MRSELLVSTMDQSFILPMRGEGLDVLVINQSTDNSGIVSAEYESRAGQNGIAVKTFKERGLSRSRNRAIDESTGDVCIVADDDVEFVTDLADIITNAYSQHPDADIIVFQATNEKGQPIKRYSTQPFWHNKRSVMGVTSFEITFRRESILQSGVRFDERFGLGARFVSGE